MMRDAARTSTVESIRHTIEQVKLHSHLIQGVTETTMSHGEAWHFGRMGQLLERADKTSRILDVKYYILLPDSRDVGTPLDVVQWSALLKSASALEMYRKRKGRMLPANVAEFLILDIDFPHPCDSASCGASNRCTKSPAPRRARSTTAPSSS